MKRWRTWLMHAAAAVLVLASTSSVNCGPTDLECFSERIHQTLNVPCSRRIAVALVGAGTFARKAHLPSLQSASDCFELVAIWSRSRQAAEALQVEDRHLQILYGEEGWRRLLSANLPGVALEMLDLVLPFPQQSRFIREALEHGLAIVSEKPIAASSREAKDLMKLAQRRWFVAENWRFEPSFRIAAAVLSSKILGPALAFTGSSLGFMPSEVSYMQPGTWRMSQDSNWIVDVGVHFAAALRLTLGDVEVVQALHRRIRPELQPFDSFAALLRAPSDAIGTWIFSLSVPKPRPREIPGLSDLTLEISGANGTLAVSRGHVELRDRFGHPVAQLRPEAPSVAYALRRAAKGVVGEVAEDVKPEEALKDLQLVEAVLSHHERLEL